MITFEDRLKRLVFNRNRDDLHSAMCYFKSGRVAFCSVLKQGHLTEDKAEPYYEVTDTILIKEEVI